MLTAKTRPEAPKNTRERVLLLLKTDGRLTTERLANELKITTMAVRQHLAVLESEKLVESVNVPDKVGRPARLWELTAKGHGRFPDNHAEFAAGMLGAIESAFGEEGLERLIKKRTQAQIQSYKTRITEKSDSIEGRLDLLTRVRCEEGYMAEWKREPDGSIVFVQNHCPIANVASLCSKLCGEELTLFREVLGEGTRVERVEYLFGGGRRCAYRVTETPLGERRV